MRIFQRSFNIDHYSPHLSSTFTFDNAIMELKGSLTASTYKRLSHNGGWRKVYLAESPWREMAIDVDSLVFFHMREYLQLPYRTSKDETMVCASFLYHVDKSTRWMVDDMARYSTEQLALLFEFLTSIGIALYPIWGNSFPQLKRELYDERAGKKEKLREEIATFGRNILAPGAKDGILALVKRYALHFRDEVRDRVSRNFPADLHFAIEPDKMCAKRHLVTMSEDVDVLFFGTKRTIIVKPFLVDIKPTHFNFVDCETYYSTKGIKSHNDFVQVALLMGTDYNNGVKGIGAKRSVGIIAKYGTIEEYVATKYDLDDDIAMAFLERCKMVREYVTDKGDDW